MYVLSAWYAHYFCIWKAIYTYMTEIITLQLQKKFLCFSYSMTILIEITWQKDSWADLKTGISNRLKLLFHNHASKKGIVIHLKYNWNWKEDKYCSYKNMLFPKTGSTLKLNSGKL
jgi:hypothetical protein